MSPAKVNLDVLREADTFGGLPAADLQTLAVCLVPRRCAAGSTLFREGDPGGALLILAEGELEAVALRPGAAPQVLNRMFPVEVVGEMAVLDPGPRSATVRAASDAVVYELTSDALEVLRERSPLAVDAIVQAAIRDVALRLRRLDERIERELEVAAGLRERP
ncbi:MAG: cyclic nucleotide-binding domain-containing protein [Polyangiaceae bacterium]|nr:cyclic nucleotide-binding domain-containing protein [Polyangiaceae bacterium]